MYVITIDRAECVPRRLAAVQAYLNNKKRNKKRKVAEVTEFVKFSSLDVSNFRRRVCSSLLKALVRGLKDRLSFGTAVLCGRDALITLVSMQNCK